MRHFSRLLPFVALLVAFGCTPKAQETAANTSTSGTPTAAPNPSSPAGSTPNGGSPTAPAPDLAAIPANLKHDAFEYYGLGNANPIDMEVANSAQSGVMTGAQTTKFEGMKDGKAVFSIERTGGLISLGMQKVTVEPDGVYATESSIVKLERELELPAELTPGKTWANRTVVDQPSQKVDVKNTFKVVGPTKVTTKAGERDALLITSTGKGQIQGQNVTINSKSWFVRGVGNVKSELTIQYPNNRTEKVTIQETKTP